MREFSHEELFSVPSPDDEVSDDIDQAISNVIRKYETKLMYLADCLKIDLVSPNSYREVIAFGYRRNHVDNLTTNYYKGEPEENMNYHQCIETMKRLNIDPAENLYFIQIAGEIGFEYRVEYLSLSASKYRME
jgi:hypothetical protein